ncbi:class I adenylate-forming enzyme family protein [Pelagerythrobacter sp.]|uniref:class I adenylate-forming enzyme family protein n=1 Tax=Pelagerythrobacter sp. TaxID=2800702 RepID=UPI0035ADE30C
MTIVSNEAFRRCTGLVTERTLEGMLASAAERWPEREFLRIGDDRRTFSQVHRDAAAMAAVLHDRGARPGDRIALVLSNCMELVTLLFASWRIGAVAVPIVPIYRTREMRSIFADARPRLIFASSEYGSRSPCLDADDALQGLEFQPDARFVIGAGETPDGWEALPVVADGSSGPAHPGEASDPCVILYTSGTTSAPKGVLASAAGFTSALDAWRLDLGLSIEDVTFTGAPLAHLGGIYTAVLLPLSLGGRSVVLPRWDPEIAIDLIEQERATIAAGATVFLRDLVERYERGSSPGHHLKIFSSSGAPTPPNLIRRADAQGIYAFRSYGMTECLGTIAHPRFGTPLEMRAETDGRVAFGSEIEIVDDERQPVEAGTLGHIRLRSPQLMLGYTLAELNDAQIDEHGWFYPGDLGRLDGDRNLTMEGRTKDIINRGGEKFSCQDIESAILKHDAVAEAAVLGKPDEKFGEVVAAFVVLSPGKVWPGDEAMCAHMETLSLARQKIPVDWRVVSEFPRTASGKIQKQALSAEFERAASAVL